MSPETRLSTAATWARRAAAALLGLVGLLATAGGWLTVCHEQVVAGTLREVCRAPRLDDGLTLAYGFVLLLLLLPDLAEVGVPGLVSVKGRLSAQEARLAAESGHREVLEEKVGHLHAMVVSSSVHSSATGGGSTVNITLPTGLAAARLASDGSTDDPVPAPVAQARYAAAEYLLSHLIDEPPDILGDVRLNLFLPVDDGSRLLPALVTDEADVDAESWEHGQGVVGQAWQSGEPVSARGEEIQRGLDTLPPQRRARYGRLTVVVAVPVLNAQGTPIGVVSAVSVDPNSALDAQDSLDELLTRADVLARVLVDLLGWATDEPTHEPTDRTRRSVDVREQGRHVTGRRAQ